jgi:hypothetical protein
MAWFSQQIKSHFEIDWKELDKVADNFLKHLIISQSAFLGWYNGRFRKRSLDITYIH